jgi:putative transposase
MLQAICRRAHRAYENFFRRVKAGQKPGFPRFKGDLRFNSITFPSYGDGCKLKGDQLYMQGVGLLKVKLHRTVGGTIKTVTLKRSCGKWYVVLTCDVEVTPLPATGQDVGIDLGLIDFLVTDAGVTWCRTTAWPGRSTTLHGAYSLRSSSVKRRKLAGRWSL